MISMKISLKNMVLHGTLILVVSSLLTIGIVSAQTTAPSFPLGPMPKLIVFILAVVISVITDTVVLLTVSGGPQPLKALISSIPWAFLNIYWWDYIAPAVGMTLFTLRFVQIGDPSWNYWIGINVIVAFICNFVFSQFIFRALRGASTTPNIQDALLAGLDAVVPTILFVVLPMLKIF